MPVPDLSKPANGSPRVAAEVRSNFVAIGTAVKVRSSSNADVSGASGAQTLQTFNVDTDDSDGFHDVAVNNSRFVVPAGFGGFYLVTVRLRFEGVASPTGYRQVILCKNAAGVYSGAAIVGNTLVPAVTTASTYTEVPLSVMVTLAAGDYLEVFFSHNQGAAVKSIAVASTIPSAPSFEMVRLGA